MKRSLNEIGGMIHKAARGAGIPLGLADDLAAAGAYHVASGGAATEITEALQDDTGVAFRGPVAIDAVLCDGQEQHLSNVRTPRLLMAMIATRNVAVQADLRDDGVTLRVGPIQDTENPTGPVVIPDVDWDVWMTLAAKTYVPATEASRLGGAGAGLNDND